MNEATPLASSERGARILNGPKQRHNRISILRSATQGHPTGKKPCKADNGGSGVWALVYSGML